ncbi:helix-turn-helix domain-containing protein [Nocardia terpenica]|uniref:HTH cro/C1-type domain-containing protein n=1 Tax=Nocardia terpenica TaxID=455432 RepID=A0A164H0B6_9NOCA|nr:helix-turn-helix transcriptional regulator [Nocardia terpenica]KZM68095.1 hypothetical protein AWN90_09135 [Nocardia terpenica]NQE89050.1 helix-turn-helix transcriptional regulator [Nocardia terpenica]
MSRAPSDTEQLFVVNFRAARKALKLPQAQVAVRMRQRGYRWSESTVSRIEHGHHRPQLREAAALAEIVAIPLDRMVTDPPTRIVAIVRDSRERVL